MLSRTMPFRLLLLAMAPWVPLACCTTALPAPVQVCVAGAAGLQPGLASPSLAGAYDPHSPVDPALLNWMVPGACCVTYPGPGRPRAACTPDGTAVPVVEQVFCGQ